VVGWAGSTAVLATPQRRRFNATNVPPTLAGCVERMNVWWACGGSELSRWRRRSENELGAAAVRTPLTLPLTLLRAVSTHTLVSPAQHQRTPGTPTPCPVPLRSQPTRSVLLCAVSGVPEQACPGVVHGRDIAWIAAPQLPLSSTRFLDPKDGEGEAGSGACGRVTER
jgi:hypothetical protein